MAQLRDRFGYRFKEVSDSPAGYPRYFLGKSDRAGKSIHLVLVTSAQEAQRFIFSAQYDIDRVGFSNGSFQFDERVGEAAIRQAILTKHASHVEGIRDLTLFSTSRPSIEARHRIKLVRRGFSIHDNRNRHYASNHFRSSARLADSGDDPITRLL
jgi:hypothetical protein